MVVYAGQGRQPDAIAYEAGIRALLASFAPVSLDALGERNLQERFDTKFLLHIAELPALLDDLRAHYRVLDIGGNRLSAYQTLYFDTPAFDLYMAQHNGRPDRYKVRSRRYVETRQAFVEVKHKDGNGRTRKDRIATSDMVVALDEAARSFVAVHVPGWARALEPKLWNRYSRVTLVDWTGRERVTFDLDLGFGTERVSQSFPGLVVAELKQERIDRGSPFLAEMRLRGEHASSFSKYCVGAALLFPGLKRNRFNAELLHARRVIERYRDHE